MDQISYTAVVVIGTRKRTLTSPNPEHLKATLEGIKRSFPKLPIYIFETALPALKEDGSGKQ
jgi:hypothetical protein